MTDSPSYVLRCEGLVGQTDHGGPPVIGLFLVDCDVDAYDGLGHAEWTTDWSKALRFPTSKAAFEYWQRPSTVRPLRADGRSNRPLTAFSVSVEIAP